MRDRTVRHQGEAVCCDCGGPLGWEPKEIKPGAFYICAPCEAIGIDTGSLIRPEEFFGEWELFSDEGEG